MQESKTSHLTCQLCGRGDKPLIYGYCQYCTCDYNEEDAHLSEPEGDKCRCKLCGHEDPLPNNGLCSDCTIFRLPDKVDEPEYCIFCNGEGPCTYCGTELEEGEIPTCIQCREEVDIDDKGLCLECRIHNDVDVQQTLKHLHQ